jgi:proline iminopeptidase
MMLRAAARVPRFARALPLLALAVAAGCQPTPSELNERALTPGAHVASISGSQIAYHVEGSGPIVLVHPGGPGMEWSYLRMPELETFAKVVYIEPIGTGRSSRQPGPRGFSMARYVSDVEALRSYLGPKTFILLGHSHGGFVAQSYALQHPGRLKGLILYSTTPTTGTEWQKDVEAGLAAFQREPWFSDATTALAQETRAQTDEEITAIFHREFPLYFADWASRSKEYEAYREQTRLFIAPIKAIVPQSPDKVGAAPTFEVRNRLGSIKVPTLVIAGKKDFITPEKYGRLLHQSIPGSRLVILGRSGHMGHIEEPGVMADAMRSFIGSLPK